MTRLRTRPATADDRPAIVQANADMQEFERRLHDSRRPGPDVAAGCYDELLRVIGENDGVLVVAEIDGAFVGYGSGCIERYNSVAETDDSNVYGLVRDVYVVPTHRGQGIATRLIQAVEDHLRRRGISRLRINMLYANESARNAYRKAGFAPYEIMMEKRVKPL